MQTIKKALINLKSNLWFLMSFSGIIALSYGSDHGLYLCALLLFVACLIGCFFVHCPLLPSKDIFKNRKAVLLAAAVELTFIMIFYKNFTPGILQTIALKLQLSPQWLFIVLGLFFCIVSFYATYLLAFYCLKVLHPFKTIVVQYWKPLLILSVLFGISLIAIIRANYNYVDDLGRINGGYNLTGSFSRYIASFMATFFHSSWYLSDISPFPQLLAGCILAFAAITLYAIITDNRKINIWGLLALIPVGTFPLFLHCYSYKYDAPYMAFSVLVAIAPLVYRKAKFIKFALATAVGTILVCTTYQASSGIFPLVSVAICLVMWKQNTSYKNILKFLSAAVSGYVLGMIVFRFLLMTPIDGEYVNTTVSLSAVLPNIREYFLRIGMWFSPVWIMLLLIVIFSFVTSVIQTTERNKIVTLLLTLCSISLMGALSFGTYIVFEGPLFTPRGMYGLGIAVAVCCIHVSISGKRVVGQAAVALLSFSFFIFSFTYGNALNMQNEYTHLRLEQVVSDLKDLEVINTEHEVSVQITGTIGHPGHLEGVIKEFPLLDELVTVQLSDSSWCWGCYELVYYTGINNLSIADSNLDFTQYNLPVLIDNEYHTIRGDSSHLLIELK